jgi:hypothetical protein
MRPIWCTPGWRGADEEFLELVYYRSGSGTRVIGFIAGKNGICDCDF